jgi:hypothetical protein
MSPINGDAAAVFRFDWRVITGENRPIGDFLQEIAVARAAIDGHASGVAGLGCGAHQLAQ